MKLYIVNPRLPAGADRQATNSSLRACIEPIADFIAAAIERDSALVGVWHEGEAGTASTENPPAVGTEGKTSGSPARPGDLKSDKTAGGANSGAASGTGATAGNIPDGSDDDIVARRLRKAAEQETDPELKEKLWKEYIEYKKNAGK